VDEDYYSQRAALPPHVKAQQQVLFDNTARAMGDAPKAIKVRQSATA